MYAFVLFSFTYTPLPHPCYTAYHPLPFQNTHALLLSGLSFLFILPSFSLSSTIIPFKNKKTTTTKDTIVFNKKLGKRNAETLCSVNRILKQRFTWGHVSLNIYSLAGFSFSCVTVCQAIDAEMIAKTARLWAELGYNWNSKTVFFHWSTRSPAIICVMEIVLMYRSWLSLSVRATFDLLHGTVVLAN